MYSNLMSLSKGMIKIALAYFFVIFLISCSADPHSAIVKHWVLDLDAVSEEVRRGRQRSGEFEFKKDGTMNIYNEGRIVFNSTYAMASDGNSFVINGPAGEGPMTFQIVNLDSRSLIIIPVENNRVSKDTAFFKPK